MPIIDSGGSSTTTTTPNPINNINVPTSSEEQHYIQTAYNQQQTTQQVSQPVVNNPTSNQEKSSIVQAVQQTQQQNTVVPTQKDEQKAMIQAFQRQQATLAPVSTPVTPTPQANNNSLIDAFLGYKAQAESNDGGWTPEKKAAFESYQKQAIDSNSKSVWYNPATGKTSSEWSPGFLLYSQLNNGGWIDSQSKGVSDSNVRATLNAAAGVSSSTPEDNTLAAYLSSYNTTPTNNEKSSITRAVNETNNPTVDQRVGEDGLITVIGKDYSTGKNMPVELVGPKTQYEYGDVSENNPGIPAAKPASLSGGGLNYIHNGAYNTNKSEMVLEAFFSGRSLSELQGLYGTEAGKDALNYAMSHAVGSKGVLGDSRANIEFSKNDIAVENNLNMAKTAMSYANNVPAIMAMAQNTTPASKTLGVGELSSAKSQNSMLWGDKQVGVDFVSSTMFQLANAKWNPFISQNKPIENYVVTGTEQLLSGAALGLEGFLQNPGGTGAAIKRGLIPAPTNYDGSSRIIGLNQGDVANQFVNMGILVGSVGLGVGGAGEIVTQRAVANAESTGVRNAISDAALVASKNSPILQGTDILSDKASQTIKEPIQRFIEVMKTPDEYKDAVKGMFDASKVIRNTPMRTDVEPMLNNLAHVKPEWADEIKSVLGEFGEKQGTGVYGGAVQASELAPENLDKGIIESFGGNAVDRVHNDIDIKTATGSVKELGDSLITKINTKFDASLHWENEDAPGLILNKEGEHVFDIHTPDSGELSNDLLYLPVRERDLKIPGEQGYTGKVRTETFGYTTQRKGLSAFVNNMRDVRINEPTHRITSDTADYLNDLRVYQSMFEVNGDSKAAAQIGTDIEKIATTKIKFIDEDTDITMIKSGQQMYNEKYLGVAKSEPININIIRPSAKPSASASMLSRFEIPVALESLMGSQSKASVSASLNLEMPTALASLISGGSQSKASSKASSSRFISPLISESPSVSSDISESPSISTELSSLISVSSSASRSSNGGSYGGGYSPKSSVSGSSISPPSKSVSPSPFSPSPYDYSPSPIPPVTKKKSSLSPGGSSLDAAINGDFLIHSNPLASYSDVMSGLFGIMDMPKEDKVSKFYRTMGKGKIAEVDIDVDMKLDMPKPKRRK